MATNWDDGRSNKRPSQNRTQAAARGKTIERACYTVLPIKHPKTEQLFRSCSANTPIPYGISLFESIYFYHLKDALICCQNQKSPQTMFAGFYAVPQGLEPWTL